MRGPGHEKASLFKISSSGNLVFLFIGVKLKELCSVCSSRPMDKDESSVNNKECLFFIPCFWSLSLYISLSISLYIFLSLSISLYIFLSLSISLYIFLSLSISLYLSLSLFLSLYIFLSLSISLYIFLMTFSCYESMIVYWTLVYIHYYFFVVFILWLLLLLIILLVLRHDSLRASFSINITSKLSVIPSSFFQLFLYHPSLVYFFQLKERLHKIF